MPWENMSLMEQKQQFINLLMSDQFTRSELCLTFGISRKTGHKWRDRYVAEGMAGLVARSSAPKSVTGRTDEAVERLIVLERRLHPTWGAKKIQRVLSECFRDRAARPAGRTTLPTDPDERN
jgi:transposase-like protein